MGLFKRRTRSPVERLMAAANLPTGGGEIPVRAVVMQVARRDSRRVAPALAVVEELLAEDGDASHIALEFLEGLQNATSHGTDGLVTTEELLPLRGQRTVDAWDIVDRFWSAVVAWCDETGLVLESSATLRDVQNPGLRLVLWPSCRSLPDGRRVRLSEVIRYEKATGEPMPAYGHHTA